MIQWGWAEQLDFDAFGFLASPEIAVKCTLWHLKYFLNLSLNVFILQEVSELQSKRGIYDKICPVAKH